MSTDIILIAITAAVVLTDILLALLISTVLPLHVTDKENWIYRSSTNYSILFEECECAQYAPNELYTNPWGPISTSSLAPGCNNDGEPTEKPAEEPANEPAEKPADKPAERTAEKSDEKRPDEFRKKSEAAAGDGENLPTDPDYEVYDKVRRDIPDVAVTKRGHLMREHPYLVSLTLPAYLDESLDLRVFACTGVILSESYILTGTSCIKEESELAQLMVRSASPYWCRFGRTNTISSSINTPIKHLSVLKVEPKLVLSHRVQPVKFPAIKEWTVGSALGWNDNMYKKNSTNYKKEKFSVKSFTTVPCPPDAIADICQETNDSSCSRLFSYPLVTSCGELAGLKYKETEKCNEFFDFNSVELVRFLNQLLGKRGRTSSIKERSCLQIYDNRCYPTMKDMCETSRE